MPWNKRNKESNQWVGYDTKQQTDFIVAFLNERLEFITIRHIERHLGLFSQEIGHVLYGQVKSFSPEVVMKLSEFLTIFGFQMPVFQYTLDEILRKVSELSKMPVKLLKKHTKRHSVVIERYLIMYFYVELNGLKRENYASIGKELGGFDHGTVSHAIKTVTNLMEFDCKFREKVEKYKNEIQYHQNNLNPNRTE